MKSLADSRWIKFKGALFLVLGLACAALLLSQDPKPATAVLLFLTVWSFCRFYYFAFYVIEHYVDPTFRFSGLFSFVLYWLRRQPR
jgi:MFS superfamily sulfate permease-like transporter